MKPGRSTSPTREITTVEPGSKSVTGPDWEPEPPQTPITQPEPGPEKTLTAQPAPKTQQGPNTQQEAASQQRPLTQQEPLAQHEAESQQETRAQQKSASEQELLAPREPAPQQSPPIRRVSFTPQEAASQQGAGPEQESGAERESELGEGQVARPEPGPAEPPLAQKAAGSTPPDRTESLSPEKPGQSDPGAQETAPANPGQGSSTECGFLSKLHRLSLPQPALDWKTFLKWVTDADSESDSGCPHETDSPAVRGGAVTQGTRLDFKGKPGYEVTSGSAGTSTQGKPRDYWDTGELGLKARESPRDSY